MPAATRRALHWLRRWLKTQLELVRGTSSPVVESQLLVAARGIWRDLDAEGRAAVLRGEEPAELGAEEAALYFTGELPLGGAAAEEQGVQNPTRSVYAKACDLWAVTSKDRIEKQRG